MAVAVHNAVVSSTFAVSSSWNLANVTITAGATVLVAGIGYVTAVGPTVTGVVWDPTGANVALTRAREDHFDIGGTEIWYLVNPPTGTKTLAASFNSSEAGAMNALTFDGSDTKVKFNNATGGSGNSFNSSLAVTGSVGSITYSVEQTEAGNAASNSLQTEIFNTVDANTQESASRAAGTATHGWTFALRSVWMMSGINIPALSVASRVTGLVEKPTYATIIF